MGYPSIIGIKSKGREPSAYFGFMRGYQKRVIFLKNTGSELFEEAYFVVKDGMGEKRSHLDMVGEANRIIEENYEKKKRFTFPVNLALSFLAGALITLIFCLIF